MAKARYIEKLDGDTWESVSTLFSCWLKSNHLTEDFGWSEGDTLTIAGDMLLICFLFPEKHGEKIDYFEHWAKTTDRLYGVRSNRRVNFPKRPELDIVLPSETPIEVPPWLK